MIQLTPHMKILVAVEPVDFRKGMRALAILVEQELGRDPFAETLYVFTNRRRTAVKCGVDPV